MTRAVAPEGRRDMTLSVVVLGRDDRRARHPAKMGKPRPADFIVAEHWAWIRERTSQATPRQTEEIWRLWDALPEAEQARCHLPKYGLLGVRQGREVFRASICFQCNNIFTWCRDDLGAATESAREFDAESTCGRDLLSLLRTVAG